MRPGMLLLTAGLLVAGLSSPAGAQSPGPESYRIRIEGFTWDGDIEGQIQKGFGDGAGTLLDLNDDLGLSQSRVYGFGGSIRLGRSWKLRGSYTPIDYDGDAIARQNFNFGDDEYFVGDRVLTTLQGKYYTAGLQWDFVSRPAGYFGAFIEAKVLDGDFVLVAPGTGNRDVESGVAPAPTLGISSRVYGGKHFSTEFEYSGMWFGSRGHVTETKVAIRLHLSDRLAGMGGYRKLNIEGKPTEERDFVKVKLSGLIFGVELSL